MGEQVKNLSRRQVADVFDGTCYNNLEASSANVTKLHQALQQEIKGAFRQARARGPHAAPPRAHSRRSPRPAPAAFSPHPGSNCPLPSRPRSSRLSCLLIPLPTYSKAFKAVAPLPPYLCAALKTMSALKGRPIPEQRAAGRWLQLIADIGACFVACRAARGLTAATAGLTGQSFSAARRRASKTRRARCLWL